MTEDMVSTILMEETGAMRRLKRNDKKRTKKRRRVQSSFDDQHLVDLERAQAKVLVHNNIYEYASLLDIPRRELDVLERYFKDSLRQAHAQQSKLLSAHEQLTGSAELVNQGELDLLLEHTDLSHLSADIVGNFGKPSEAASLESDYSEDTSAIKFGGVPHYVRSHTLQNKLFQALGSTFMGSATSHEFGNNPSMVDSTHASGFSGRNDSIGDFFSIGGSTLPSHTQRPSSHPELSQVSEMTSVMHSQSARALPPLRVQKPAGKQSRPRKRILAAAGFDESLTRETPRLLHYSNAEDPHDTFHQVEALRRELYASKVGLNQLNKMVDTNIAWVQQNCDMSQWSGHISLKAQRKCRIMATDRITKVFAGFVHRSLQWTLQRWRNALQAERFQTAIIKYCKAKGIVAMTKQLVKWHLRAMHWRWMKWIRFVQAQRRVEHEAATIELQRVMRGCLGRRLVQNLRFGKAATHIQCLFRRIHAGHVVRAQRRDIEIQVSNEAALIIQNKLQSMLQIKQAKAELEKRKSQKAAVRIQKVFRGQQGRDDFQRKHTEKATLKPAPAAALADQHGTDLDALALHLGEHLPEKLVAAAVEATQAVVDSARSSHNMPTEVEAIPTVAKRDRHGQRPRKDKPKKIVKKEGKPSKSTSSTQDAATMIQKVARGKLVRSLSIKVAATAPILVDRADEQVAVEPSALNEDLPAASLDVGKADEVAVVEVDNVTPPATSQEQVDTAEEQSAAPTQEQRGVDYEEQATAMSGEHIVKELHAGVDEEVGQQADQEHEVSILTTSVAAHDELAASSSSRPNSAQSTGSSHSAHKKSLFSVNLPAIPSIKGSGFFKNPFGSWSSVKSTEQPSPSKDDLAPTMAAIVDEGVEGGEDDSPILVAEEAIEAVNAEPLGTGDLEVVPTMIDQAPEDLVIEEIGHFHEPSAVEDVHVAAEGYQESHESAHVRVEELIGHADVSTASVVSEASEGESHVVKTIVEKKAPAKRVTETKKKPDRGRATKVKEVEDKHKHKEVPKAKDSAHKDDKQSKPKKVQGTTKSPKAAATVVAEAEEVAGDIIAEQPNELHLEQPVEEYRVPLIEELAENDVPLAEGVAESAVVEQIATEDSVIPSVTGQQRASTDDAALKVQQMARSRLAKQKIEKKREEVARAQREAEQAIEWATVTIQRNIRGKIGRQRFRVTYEKRKVDEEQKKKEGAAKIQSHLRGVRDRKRVAAIRQAKEAEESHIDWLKSYQKKEKKAPPPLATQASEVNEPSAETTPRPLTPKKPQAPPSPTTPVRSSSMSSKSGKSGKPRTPPLSQSSVPHHPPPGTPHSHEPLATPHPPTMTHSAKEVPDPRLDSLDARLRQLEDVERRIKQSEVSMLEETKKAEERIQAQLALLEQKARQAEVEQVARDELLKLAVGTMSHHNTLGPQQSARMSHMHSTGMGHMHSTGTHPFNAMMSTRTSAPPTARSAKMGPIPTDAPRLIYQGHEWVQLWDDDNQSYYWWCPMTQVAQWEQPGMEQFYSAAQQKPFAEDESGYESSGGALTDYSTDHDTSYFDSEAVDADWQEYWDEQAQAKYWYNNATGEASWTKPTHLLEAHSQHSSRAITADGSSHEALVPSTGPQDAAHGWISYIDEQTGQLYWHHAATGELRWDY